MMKGRKPMFNLFNTVYATGTENGTTTNPDGISGMIMFVGWIVILFLLMYFMMIRPQKKQQKEMQKMIAALEVGDKIVTIGGICGKVVKIKDDNIWIVTGKNTDEAEKCCIKFERSAIKSVDKKVQE